MGELGLVEKRLFEMSGFKTWTGHHLEQVRVGWESYGKLNARKDNAILVGHYFSASSHAAGRYRAEDPQPGYWDAIIGPGKALDTDRYFVLSVDSLVNVNVNDGYTVTTGPSSIDPRTGRPFGLSFPIVTIPDFVRVQRAVIDSLGIDKLHAVVGPSMGGLMAYEWAAAFPERVKRIIPVIATPTQGPYACVQLDLWSAAVRLDPNWKGGNYYGGPPPSEGVALSLYSILATARHPEWAAANFGRALSNPDRSPLQHLDAVWSAQSALMDVARARAPIVDANHMLYMTRANQLFQQDFATSVDPGLKRIRADALVIASRTDKLFTPEDTRRFVQTLQANGTRARYHELDSNGGHYAGVVDVAMASREIAAFLGD